MIVRIADFGLRIEIRNPKSLIRNRDYRSSMAIILKGAPLPPWIFMGRAMIWNPFSGS